jgi:hypothetical protein
MSHTIHLFSSGNYRENEGEGNVGAIIFGWGSSGNARRGFQVDSSQLDRPGQTRADENRRANNDFRERLEEIIWRSSQNLNTFHRGRL